MNISYTNNFDSEAVSFSSEVEGYEATNTQDIHLSKYWKTTGITDEWLKINGTLTPQSAYIAGTNLTSSAIVKIQGNDSDVWTSPTVDITLTLGENEIWSTTAEMTEQDYWRFSIVDTTNPVAYLTVGRAWIGPLLSVRGPYISFKENQVDTSATTLSISGQVYGDVGYRFKSYSLTYPWWNATEKTNIETFSLAVHKSQPIFISFGNIGPIYSILTNDIDFDHLKNMNIWSSRLDFVEVF